MKKFFVALGILVLCGALVTLAALIGAPAPTQDQAAAAPDYTASVDKATLEAQLARIEAKGLKGAKDPFDQPAEANDFYLMQRTGGDPLDYELIAVAKEQVAAMPQATITSTGVVIHAPGEDIASRAAGDITGWTELGPGNIGGRTRTILIDPGTPATMYAGAVAGGVWKTTNTGTTWTKLDDLMTNLAVSTMAFEGSGGGGYTTSTIYAGTGEGFFNADAVRGAGIFKSTDSGATWSQLASTANSNFYYVNKIVADVSAAGTMFAATRTGVWKTTDGGATAWTNVLADTGGGGSNATITNTSVGITDIEIAGNTLIASNGTWISDGIYRSANSGSTWSRVHAPTNIGRSDLAIAPNDTQYMYAISSNVINDRLLQVYRSTDNGVNWSPRITSSGGVYSGSDVNWLLLTNPLFANLNACGFGADQSLHQGWYDNIIAVAPHNRDIVYAGGIDLFRSNNGGTDWGVISHWWVSGFVGYAHADQHTIEFHPSWNGSGNQIMFVGNDGGIFKTTNAIGGALASGTNSGICYSYVGDTPTSVLWTDLNNGYNVTQFYNGRPLGSTTSYMGGTQDNGTLLGSDGGGINAWTEEFGGDGGYVSYDPSDTTTRFAETTGLSIIRQYQGAIDGFGDPDYQSIISGISDGGFAFIFINAFRHDPSNRDRMWTGGFYPWRSNLASTAALASNVTWTQAGAITDGSGTISAWAVDPNDSDNVWLGLTDGYVQKTTTGMTSTSGTTWTTERQGASDWGGSAYASWVEVDGNDATGDTVYVTNSRFGGSTAKVFRTANGGTSWSDITNNLPDIPVHCVVVQPGNASNIFLGTDLGVFVSQNTGASWASMNQSPDFTNTVVETLEFQNSTTLYAFTHGRSAWRATVSLSGPFSPVYVDAANTPPGAGTSGNPFADLQDGIDKVSSGGIINIVGGTYDISTPQTITVISTWNHSSGGTVTVK